MTINDEELIDKLGIMLEGFIKDPDQEYMDGEIYIFLGTKDKKGKRGVRFFSGTNVNSSFKERVCEQAMDILLKDEGNYPSIMDNYNTKNRK